jgi:exopolyphosphatase/guanosine-5'-triphosphate,3'-diphosphate pyrophosphatase
MKEIFMNRFAVIDFGSNTIRLCVYQVEDTTEGSITKKHLSTLLNYKVMAGISSYVKEGKISDKGIKKAARTIKEQHERAKYFNCTRIEVFATAVLRNCKNSCEAQRTIEKACGLPITILSNEAEAHLGVVGAKLDGPIEDATMVDIGGGSTELTALSAGLETASTSLPQGSLSSFSMYVNALLPTEKEMERIESEFEKLYALLPKKDFKSKTLVGIGGAIRSAAKVYGDIFCAGKRSNVLLLQHIDDVLYSYREDPEGFMRCALQTIPDRIHTFIPGCILIKHVFEKTGADRLRIAKHGVREGFLIEHML